MNAPAEPRRRILVVDDEAAVREKLELRLAAAGYEVFLAEDAFAARRLLYEARPQLMIVDAQMASVSGVDLIAELIAEPALPWVPVVFITEPVAALVALVERVLVGERSGRRGRRPVRLGAA